VELKARRDEAEQDHLTRHQQAVAQTQKYLDDSTKQLADTNARTVELRALNEKLDAGARDEAKVQRSAANDEAERIVREAEERAAALLADTETRTRELVTDAEDRLAQIRIERDAVAGYFESLRSVLTQAEKVNADKD
jgi:uncharacterized protein YjgD (DUF1641 family)